MGREDVLDEVRSYLMDPGQRRAYLIHGPTGSGKTCLLGKVATLAGERDDNGDDGKTSF